MTTWADMLVAGLWQAGWAVVPVALVVAAVCRFGKCNATTRHALWLTTFAGLLAAMWLPGPTVEPPPAPEPIYFVGRQNTGGMISAPIPFVPVVRGNWTKPGDLYKDDNATTAQVAASVEPTPPRTAACSAESPAAWLASTADRLRRLSIPLLEQFEQGREWVREFSSASCSDTACNGSAILECNDIAQGCSDDDSECEAVCCQPGDSKWVDAAASTSNWITSIPSRIADGFSATRSELGDVFVAAAVNAPPHRQHAESPSAVDLAASAIASLGPVRTTSNPDELDPWPGEPGAEFSAAAEWQRFASRLLGVRDAVGLVPPLPTTAWAIGFIGVAGLLIVRTLSAAQRLRRAQPADADTLRLVEREARRLGLKSPPETLLIDDRVSPLIWCGKRVRLILPRSFWSDLDYDARRAVICHELAHIRRRDHWVRRLEILVTCLYWWHPVMWYVRAKMAEEADACCDEWVTWVLPRERRAYARALLAATDFVSGSVAPKPFAVAMASARAAKIARRLTMIMTATRRPSLGLAGICGILVMAALAWVATPAQSCPPEEQEATTSQNRLAPVAAQTITVKARNTGETGDGVSEGDESDDPVFADEAAMADRLRKIEESQRKLSAELREISKHLNKHGAATPAPSAGQARSLWSTTPTPAAPHAVAPMIAQRSPFAATAPDSAFAGMIAGPRPGFEQPIVSRKYELSGDRLEALTELMIRDDVPVLVSPTDDGIEVHGTEAQQAVFAAFIKMITANEKATEITLPDEKMAAVKKLAALESVPTRFNISGDTISVLGTPAEQAVFDAFIALIHPKTPAGSSTWGAAAVAPVPAVPPVSPFAPAQPATPAPGAMKRKPGKPKAGQPAIAPGSAAAEQSPNALTAIDWSESAEYKRAKELENELKSAPEKLKNIKGEGADHEKQIRARMDQMEAKAVELKHLYGALAVRAEQHEKRNEGIMASASKRRAEMEARRSEIQSRLADLKAERTALEGQADHLEAEADTVEAKAEKAEKSEAEALKRHARDMRTQAKQSRRNATRLEAQVDKLAEAIAELEIEAAGMAR